MATGHGAAGGGGPPAPGGRAADDVLIRAYEPGDDEECVELLRAAVPYTLQTVELWRHRLTAAPVGSKLGAWVARRDGRLIGYANGFLAWWAGRDDAGWGGVLVRPEEERRGVGSRLADMAESHVREVGARDLRAHTDEEHLGFATGRGYTAVSRKRVSAVDPRTVSGEPALPVVPLRELQDRREELYRLDLAASVDMPNEGDFSVPFEQWLKDVWDDPLLSLDGSFAVVLDGRIAGATYLRVAGTRAGSGFTGTYPVYRGRGVATSAKLAALRWAARHGVEQAHTFNDDTNAAMLGINERLGYRPWVTTVDVVREL